MKAGRSESGAAARRFMVLGFFGLVVTIRGTGFSPRELTPGATPSVLEGEAPGLREAMRMVNQLARLSRGRAGSLGGSLIPTTPGSPGGAQTPGGGS